VRQVSPLCRVAGRFTVRGHTGVNRVRFAGRVHGEQLGAGTYKLIARTRSGRAVARVTLVVVEGSAPSKAELAAARRADVCGTTFAFASTRSTSSELSAGNLAAGEQLSPSLAPQVSALGPAIGTHATSGVLASSVEKAARAVRPLLVALLAVAILLLGLAALPGAAVADARVSDLLARHRIEIAGLGAIALVAVALAFLLG
jgi:hypothetical protein